jgi:hypothetical protein
MGLFDNQIKESTHFWLEFYLNYGDHEVAYSSWHLYDKCIPVLP